jgi:4-diphosphocytidyl-2-C-methyl-D-erythritol kinase
LITFPGSKINLGLYITAKRADGYHDIQTVFYPTAFTDVLEIVPAREDSLETTGIPIAGNIEDNLCMKALRLMQATYGIGRVAMYLHKIVPMGAGLGGGSADAAALLLMLNRHFELKLGRNELLPLAARLGSDCAFFVDPKPAFAHGKGNELKPIDLHLSGWYLVLVCPAIGSSTAEAYRGIVPLPANLDLQDLPNLPVEAWKNHLHNHFERGIIEQIPQVGEIKNTLYSLGATYAAMSGSGSAVYGLFKEMPNLSAAIPAFEGCLLHQEWLP